MGIARFYVIDDFGLKATEKTFRGRPAEHNFKLALAYSGDTQIELIQHLSGDTATKSTSSEEGRACTISDFSSTKSRPTGAPLIRSLAPAIRS
jgi:hypothetical protein